MSSISTNIQVMRGLFQYQAHQQGVNQAMTRLSTGLRINRAADDPSGLVAAENLAVSQTTLLSEIKGLERTNLSLAAQDGAYSVVSDMLIELNGLVVEAASEAGTTYEERNAIQQQIDGILDGFEYIRGTAIFNGERLLDGLASNVFDSLKGLHSGGSQNALEGDLESAQNQVQNAIKTTASHRGEIGLKIRENESLMRVNSVAVENLAAAESLIRDADYAVEVSNLIREQLLSDLSLQGVNIAINEQRKVLELLAPAVETANAISKRAFNQANTPL